MLFCDDNWLYLLDRCLKALRECLLTFVQISIRRPCLHAVMQSYDMEHQSINRPLSTLLAIDCRSAPLCAQRVHSPLDIESSISKPLMVKLAIDEPYSRISADGYLLDCATARVDRARGVQRSLRPLPMTRR